MVYSIIYSNRKTISISLNKGEVSVKAPIGTDEKTIAEIVDKHAAWINKNLEIQQKREHMFSSVKSPILRSELAKQGVHNFKHIHAVKTGMQAFIALIISGGMQHAIIYQSVIVPMKHFTKKIKLRFQSFRKAS